MGIRTRSSGSVQIGMLLSIITAAAPVSAQSESVPAPSPDLHRQAGKKAPLAPIPDRVAVSALRERALSLLMEAASAPDPQLRANAIEALSRAPARLEPILAVALKDENVGVRTVAAMAVGRGRIAKLVGSIAPLLNDKSAYVRAAAIYAMRANDPQFDPTPLSTILLDDPSAKVRAHAAFILGELGDPSASGLLRQAAKERMSKAATPEVRLLQLQIAEALVKLGDEQQIETLRAALYPSSPDELEATALAVQILGQVQARVAIDQLINLSMERDKPREKDEPRKEAGQGEDKQRGMMPAEIRLAVAGSLARMGHTEGGFIADEYISSPKPALRAQVAYVFGETGRLENLNRLESLLADPDGSVRVAAAAGILKVADGSATPVPGR